MTINAKDITVTQISDITKANEENKEKAPVANLKLKFERPLPYIPQFECRNIVVVGCGGTGSHIIPHLIRLVSTIKNNYYQITFIDGDVVEEKNLIRQHFIQADVGKNKAEALAGRYSAAFGVPIGFRDKYMEHYGDFQKLIDNGNHTLIISCVDNIKTRAMIKDLINSWFSVTNWIDCGNEEMTGQVVFSARHPDFIYKHIVAGKYTMPNVFDLYPDLYTKLTTDKFSSQLSCAEMAVSSPQHGFVNLTAATLALNYIYAVLKMQPIHTNVIEFNINNKYAHKPLNLTTIEGWKGKVEAYKTFDVSKL